MFYVYHSRDHEKTKLQLTTSDPANVRLSSDRETGSTVSVGVLAALQGAQGRAERLKAGLLNIVYP